MKGKIKSQTVVPLLLICLLCSSLAMGQSKLRVAVIDFENNSTWNWWGDNLGRAAADVFVTALMESGQFSIIERDKVQALMAEQNFGASGRVTPQTAAKIGQLLGVDLMLTGSVSQFSISRTGGGIRGVSVGVTTGKVVLQARLVNTTTGEIVVAAEEENTKRLVGARVRSINFEQEFDYGMANEIMHPAVEKMVVKIVENWQSGLDQFGSEYGDPGRRQFRCHQKRRGADRSGYGLVSGSGGRESGKCRCHSGPGKILNRHHPERQCPGQRLPEENLTPLFSAAPKLPTES